MSRSRIKVSSPRGPNMMVANPQRMESEGGVRWATGRTVKGEGKQPGTYVPVEVWALKQRGPDGRVIVFRTGQSYEAAKRWISFQ